MFEKARDIYEEGIEHVMSNSDFALLYNEYINFEEKMINMYEDEDLDNFEQHENSNLWNKNTK